jgi:dTDP-L-rhamnose 4-epimerase
VICGADSNPSFVQRKGRVVMSGKPILITGGAGFIGSRLAIRLARQVQTGQNHVTVFDNFHPQTHRGNPDIRIALRRHGVNVITGDIRNPLAIGTAIAETRPDLVYHLAAETGTGQSFTKPARYCDVNIMGTAHLIDAIQRHVPDLPRIILAGSRAVYGEGGCIDAQGQPAAPLIRSATDMAAGQFQPRDRTGTALIPVPSNADCAVAPASIYASTKLMQEYLLQQAFWGSATAVGVLRLQNVYGPGQSLHNPYTGVLSIFCRQILEGRSLTLYEDGLITRDFVAVDDVVRAFVMMGQAAVMPQEVLDIGSGQGSTILEVARSLLRLLGASSERLAITGAYRPGDIRHAVADISRATNLLGWTPDIAMSTGLASLAAWSRSQMQPRLATPEIAQVGG